ncbi:MAG: caspase family protein, partial [Spirochaetales bacterium]|nr:caspase family protein [Spirochaetales bacterium]
MKRWSVLVMFALTLASILAAQTVGSGPRYALVIGNGNYVELGKLKNPVNAATDMAAALKALGFKVDLLTDGDLARMEDAVIRLGTNLAQSADSTGFFFYAGHGVQSGGVNYLIPADARIASETFLETKALAAQSVLDTLQQSRNALNVVVLDACRDNPFSWSRSGSRGLSVVGGQPPGSIVAYATSAGRVAQDGTGRNGVFTQELLKHLKTPGLEIKDVFNRTGKDVGTATSGQQVPAVYNQFFDSAYLAGTSNFTAASSPAPAAPAKAPSFGAVQAATGNLSITLATAGTVSVAGLSAAVPAGTVPVNDLAAGSQTVTVRYADGKSESRTVMVPAGGTANVAFAYAPSAKPV